MSSEDSAKIARRLDYMRPQFIRVMSNTPRWGDKEYDPAKQFNKDMEMIFNYCQKRGVTVMFGDWGGVLVNSKQDKIDTTNISNAAEFLKYLIEDKQYSCIKYYNIINEPNGHWASTKGSYSLWSRAVREMQRQMERRGLTDRVKIVGPDAAIWTTAEAWWVDSCATSLGSIIGLYDIHTYPSKITVNSGEYSNIIAAYKKGVPEGKKIVMGEIGFKYIEPEDSLYAQENERRIAACDHASRTDAQMFVYDYMYGTDMADVLMQTINGGYSGCVAWMLDDAMHSNEAPHLLKIWGFWNIIGEEKYSEEEEQVRPWYYAWSLLSHGLPQGAKIMQVEVEGQPGIRAIASEKEGKHMIAIVNVNKEPVQVRLSGEPARLKGMTQYIYSEKELRTENEQALPNAQNVTLKLDKGVDLTIDGETLIIYTDF